MRLPARLRRARLGRRPRRQVRMAVYTLQCGALVCMLGPSRYSFVATACRCVLLHVLHVSIASLGMPQHALPQAS